MHILLFLCNLTGQAGILGPCCYIYMYVLPRHHDSEQSTGNTWGGTPVYHWRTGKVAQKADNTEEDERLNISYSEIVKLGEPILSLFIIHGQLMMIYVCRIL